MKRLLTLLSLTACLAVPVLAQPAPVVSFDGRWTARFAGTDGKPHQAAVVISNFGGHWREAGKPSGCAGRQFPITVQDSSATELVLTVWRASLVPACSNLTVQLKPTGDNELTGDIEGMGAVRLTRPEAGARRR